MVTKVVNLLDIQFLIKDPLRRDSLHTMDVLLDPFPIAVASIFNLWEKDNLTTKDKLADPKVSGSTIVWSEC